MSQRKQQISFFLLPDDETNIAAEIRRVLPEVRLVDEWRWDDVSQPPVRDQPSDCGGAIGLWNSSIEPQL
ncbi:MAG TPA: hypothetical protein VFC00_26835, partial [Micromonosporaceae bacterium]|nr:hypothetical protein [Micromonosporaceae bacterium]